MGLLKPRGRLRRLTSGLHKIIDLLRNAGSANMCLSLSRETVWRTTQGFWVSSQSAGSSCRHTSSAHDSRTSADPGQARPGNRIPRLPWVEAVFLMAVYSLSGCHFFFFR